MAYGYWKSGLTETQTTFQLFFRKPPFQGGYAIAAGLETALQLIEQCSFSSDDVDFLGSLKGNDNAPLFEPAFLKYLLGLEFNVDIDAVPEGTVVLPHEPILRITGPIIPCQLLETALLTCINFQTLIATKASRVCQAATGDTVLEFGLRRAQGFDGALSATRAAYIGGVHATSNVLAAKILDIPVKGTHAHAWVMMFDTEQEAFERYADAMPNNCVFLVDTYDTIQGVERAIEVATKLRESGHEALGIRLDSGDLIDLSQRARKMLDAHGFDNMKIVASDSLNEYSIHHMKSEGAKIDIWGVGTNLVTAQDQPALGGVYKLSAQRPSPDAEWIPKIKLSNSAIKVSNPGRLQILRYHTDDGQWMYDVLTESSDTVQEYTSLDGSLPPQTPNGTPVALLQSVMLGGHRTMPSESLTQIRQRTTKSLASLPEDMRQLHVDTPHNPMLDTTVWATKSSLINAQRRD
jgi:nicotinate phosphoribosyltransferase